MKNLKVIALLFGVVFIVLSQSCENGKDETKISSHNDSESHNSGQNCMKCHKSGGEGEGWFEIAGTVYNSAGNSVFSVATISVYDGPVGEGNIVKVVEVDAKGNFYTTEDIDFSKGLYVGVKGNDELVMQSKITTGACNSCHGVSASRIEVY